MPGYIANHEGFEVRDDEGEIVAQGYVNYLGDVAISIETAGGALELGEAHKLGEALLLLGVDHDGS